MKNLTILLFVLFCITSCSTNRTTEGNENDVETPSADTAIVEKEKTSIEPAPVVTEEPVSPPEDYKGKSFNWDDIPSISIDPQWRVDSSLIDMELPFYTYQSIREDFFPLIPNEDYLITDAIVIDSVTQAGKYNEYMENHEMGMSETASIVTIGKAQYNDEISLLIWGYKFATFYDGPSGEGFSIYLSTLTSDNLTPVQTIKFGDFNAGSDAPVFGSTVKIGTIFPDGKITINTVIEDGGEDQYGQEQITITKMKEVHQLEPNGEFTLIEESSEEIEK